MKRKSILWFAKDNAMIRTNSIFFNTKNENMLPSLSKDMRSVYDTNFNLELDAFSYALHHSRWDVHWTCLDFIDHDKKIVKIYTIKTESYHEVPFSDLNDFCEFVVFKYLGSIEQQREKIVKSLDLLTSYFNGTIINHPEAIKYFIRKDYYLELERAGFPVISDTRIFPSNVEYGEILESIGGKEFTNDFIIKPVTGELANSLDLLSEIGKPKTDKHFEMSPEEWLRMKESKVGGWMVQKYHEDVWNGEYRLIFLGNVCTHGLRKRYYQTKNTQKIPSEKFRVFHYYRPTDFELDLGRRIKTYWEEEKKMKIFFFRLDFIKDKSNPSKIKILEFEAVNPGFVFKALSESDKRRISLEFVSYLDYNTFT